LTSHEVQAVLKSKKLERDFPLITTINRVVERKIKPEQLVYYAELPGL